MGIAAELFRLRVTEGVAAVFVRGAIEFPESDPGQVLIKLQ